MHATEICEQNAGIHIWENANASRLRPFISFHCRSRKSLCIVYNKVGSKLVLYIAAILLRFFSGLLLTVWDTGMWPRLSETWKYVESKRMFHDQGFFFLFFFCGRMILLELVVLWINVARDSSQYLLQLRQCPVFTEKHSALSDVLWWSKRLTSRNWETFLSSEYLKI